MSFIVVYTTHADQKNASEIVDSLVAKKLIACGNCFPINSAYWWNGAVAKEGEWVALLKTVKENWSTLKETIAAMHPYEVPCIMKFEVEANDGYEKWIRESTEIQ